jgi:hypothetical protein
VSGSTAATDRNHVEFRNAARDDECLLASGEVERLAASLRNHRGGA